MCSDTIVFYRYLNECCEIHTNVKPNVLNAYEFELNVKEICVTVSHTMFDISTHNSGYTRIHNSRHNFNTCLSKMVIESF